MSTMRILFLSWSTLGLVGAARPQGAAGSNILDAQMVREVIKVEPGRKQATQADAETEKAVLSVEHEKDEALRKRDIAVLDRIYADDLEFVNARGKVITKAQHLDE